MVPALSSIIAGHVASFPGDALPIGAQHAARRALLDAYGVMLAASGLSEEAAPFARRARAAAESGPARLIGHGLRVPLETAALANGALAHALDFGDTFDAGPAHPHAALVPALLALADAEPAIDGARFVAALALGGDLACRLSLAAGAALDARGWYSPAALGLIGAAAGCGYLLGLDADGVRNAIGLALCQASFPAAIKYDPASHVRAVREGFAARAAVTGALLAREGVAAFAAPLEGPCGFFAQHAGGTPETDALLDGLGRVFLGQHVSFKPWPSCRGTHAYIEAALRLREAHAFDPGDIVKVEVVIGPVQTMLCEPRISRIAPTSAIDAKFSIPFTLATALIARAVTLDSFDVAARADRAILALAARVAPRLHPDWGRAQAASGIVTLELADGRTLTAEVMQAAGHPDHPLSDEALVEKFVACAGRAARPMAPEQAAILARRILILGTGDSVARLFDSI